MPSTSTCCARNCPATSSEGPRERYQLDWPGKRAAFLAANAPVARTLRPVREESVDFDTTGNVFIEGDNLDALKLLQESYLGKVKLIYIDPPYNTGGDFVYDDDFAETTAEYLARSGQADADGIRLVANTEASGRFHSDWLSMMYPRLVLARNLLADDGAIFVSIDSTEHANLVKLLNEVMGEDNFRADITWQKRYTRSNNTRDFTAVVENIVVFSRSDQFAVNLLPRTAEADARYANPDGDRRGPWKGASFLNPATAAQRPNLCYEIRNPNTGQATWPIGQRLAQVPGRVRASRCRGPALLGGRREEPGALGQDVPLRGQGTDPDELLEPRVRGQHRRGHQGPGRAAPRQGIR